MSLRIPFWVPLLLAIAFAAALLLIAHQLEFIR